MQQATSRNIGRVLSALRERKLHPGSSIVYSCCRTPLSLPGAAAGAISRAALSSGSGRTKSVELAFSPRYQPFGSYLETLMYLTLYQSSKTFSLNHRALRTESKVLGRGAACYGSINNPRWLRHAAAYLTQLQNLLST